jgi:hypothetical protein
MKATSMKSLVTLFEDVLADASMSCSTNTTLDIVTVQSRFENEGFEFFTRILPKMGAGLERALDLSKASPDLFPGFRCRQNTPVFLGGFFDLIFDRTSGFLLDDPNVEAIRSVRQLTLMFKKIELDCGKARTQLAYDAFVQSNLDVKVWEDGVSYELVSEFQRVANMVFSDALSKVNTKVRDFDLAPAHGPGATAEKLMANAKYTFPSWTDRLETVAPYWRYASFRGYSSEVYGGLDMRTPERELPVRVVHVPKTAETPRIIAVEPSCMQFMQQGVARAIRDVVDHSFLVNLIGQESQESNQLLALAGSRDGNLATLDLSEASDRVSNLLVLALFDAYPDLNDLVQASRSTRADVLGHGVLPVFRFASMGSALCFPVETMVFLIVVLLGIQDAWNVRFTRPEQVEALVGWVRLYGDDIIVPVDVVPSVIKYLELFGLKVNNHKSFWSGKFRESCGKEYFDGEDVTICRVRRVLPNCRKDVDELVSAVEFRNHLYKRGWWKAARRMDSLLEGIIPFPAVAETSSALGRYSFLGFDQGRMCSKLHRPQVRAAVVKYLRTRSFQIDGDAALMKCLGYRREISWEGFSPLTYDLPFLEADHLRFAGRPDASSVYIRWAYSQ